MAVLAACAATTDMKKEGLNDTAKFFKHLHFLTGLHNLLRDKILEAKKDTFFES
jgi:hypothetical protein